MLPARVSVANMAAPRRPDPAPLETDDVRVVAIGTALWAVAFFVLLAVRARLAAHHTSWWLATCAVGVVLGLAGAVHRARSREIAARRRWQYRTPAGAQRPKLSRPGRPPP